MYHDGYQSIEGSIFARELQSILRKYGRELEQLDQLGVPNEVKRRIIGSLHHPNTFLILNSGELERLSNALALTNGDMERLHTAMLQTSASKVRLDPVEQENKKTDDRRDLGALRGDASSGEDTALDRVLMPACDLIEAGRLAQQTSRSSRTKMEQMKHARAACDSFARAVKVLEKLPRDIRRTSDWMFWRQSAEQDLHEAKQWLAKIELA
jgi:hypothetical protein